MNYPSREESEPAQIANDSRIQTANARSAGNPSHVNERCEDIYANSRDHSMGVQLLNR